MSCEVSIRTASEVTAAYFAAILPCDCRLTRLSEAEKIPPCELVITDLDTVSPPRSLPRGCRHLTLGSEGTPDLLRPMTDEEILLRLFPSPSAGDEPKLLDAPPRLFVSGESVALTAREARILALLFDGDEVSVERLLSEIRTERGADRNLLRVTLSNLRKKLVPYYIRIEPRRGSYRLTFSRGD